MNDQSHSGAQPGQPSGNRTVAASAPGTSSATVASQGSAHSDDRERPKRRRRRRGRRNANPNAADRRQQNADAKSGSDSAQPRQELGTSTSEPARPKKRRRTRRSGPANSQASSSSENARKPAPQPAKQHNRNAAKTAAKSAAKSGTRGPNRVPRTAAYRPNQESSLRTSDEISAGGLVISGLAEAVGPDQSVDLDRIYVALIGRLDRRGRLLWSMPKGHVEPGEDRAATAEREVWEETGVCGKVLAELGVIDYWFVSEGVRIHKTVHHHLLEYVDGDLNDEDPEVTEVAWIPASQLLERLAYADERKLARIAHDLLPEFALQASAEGRLTPR